MTLTEIMAASWYAESKESGFKALPPSFVASARHFVCLIVGDSLSHFIRELAHYFTSLPGRHLGGNIISLTRSCFKLFAKEQRPTLSKSIMMANEVGSDLLITIFNE